MKERQGDQHRRKKAPAETNLPVAKQARARKPCLPSETCRNLQSAIKAAREIPEKREEDAIIAVAGVPSETTEEPEAPGPRPMTSTESPRRKGRSRRVMVPSSDRMVSSRCHHVEIVVKIPSGASCRSGLLHAGRAGGSVCGLAGKARLRTRRAVPRFFRKVEMGKLKAENRGLLPGFCLSPGKS